MISLIRAVAVALMLTPAAGAAQDFNAGQDAYVEGDYTNALQELQPLAEQGQAVPQNDAEAVHWFRIAAVQGNADAQYNLGNRYLKGQGVPQDYISAHVWFNIAAANGNERATDARVLVETRIPSADLSKAQRRARICMEWTYQDCD